MKCLLNLAAAVVFMLSAGLSHSQINPEKVYLVTNKGDPDSIKIAELYCELRGVPKANIIELGGISTKYGRIVKEGYFALFENPLIKELVKRGAIKAAALGTKDAYGRDKYAFMSHDIDFIILCKGIPWGVNSTDPEQMKIPNAGRSDSAAIDSELSARFLESGTLDGPAKNPLFNNLLNRDLYKSLGVLRVARLDGATYADVENALVKSLYAEKAGIRGVAYIDKAQKSKLADGWLEDAGKQLKELYFETVVDNERTLMRYGDRLDGLAFYFGWYSGRMYCYFLEEGFHFAPGAVGFHIFSFSAADMRNPLNWTPGFVHFGAGFTVGNVYEPFLTGTHQPDIMVRALIKGMSAGEAAYASIPGLSWQNIICEGDPMYTPFKVSLEEQMKNIDEGKTDEYSQYAVIRMMNKMAVQNRDMKGAVALGMEYLEKIPNSALIWKLHELSEDAAIKKGLALRLAGAKPWKDPMYYGLTMKLIDYLSLSDDKALHQKAMDIYGELLAEPKQDAFERFLLSMAKGLAKWRSIELPPSAVKMENEIAKRDAEAAAKSAAGGASE